MLLAWSRISKRDQVEDLTFEKNKITGATVLCATGEIKKLTAKKQLYAAVLGVKNF